jgi:DtxR family Mn-dependent transcriptional regulator
MEGLHDLREEILEIGWYLEEDGEEARQALHELAADQDVRGEMAKMAAEGLVEPYETSLCLTAAGRALARHVVRAHRLAARFLTDILEVPASVIENQACRLEHAISSLVADSLCTLLGHPPLAPDGRPIPRGACCSALKPEVLPAIRPLAGLDLGAAGRVTFIHSPRRERLEQLSALGLIPGTQVRLRQRSPAVVVEIGESTLALDAEVAGDIFVKPA